MPSIRDTYTHDVIHHFKGCIPEDQKTHNTSDPSGWYWRAIRKSDSRLDCAVGPFISETQAQADLQIQIADRDILLTYLESTVEKYA